MATATTAVLRVHYPQPPDDSSGQHLRDLLRADLVDLTIGDRPEPATFEVLVAGRPPADELDASPHLRALVIPYAGIPTETRDLLVDRPSIAAHNLHHNATSTAEMAVALMMAAARHIVPIDRQFRAHDWSSRFRNTSLELAGKAAVILGYGAIGQRVARVCQALGMTIHAVRRRADARTTTDDGVHLHPRAALGDLLPAADVLHICLPLTEETTGLLGAPQLAAMPSHALLINIGRGPIVDEQALYEALRDGVIGAAGLDVWYRYPGRREGDTKEHTPPSDYPFHELDNVVMSPHHAGHSTECDSHRMRDLAELLHALASGESPNRIDLNAGY